MNTKYVNQVAITINRELGEARLHCFDTQVLFSKDSNETSSEAVEVVTLNMTPQSLINLYNNIGKVFQQMQEDEAPQELEESEAPDQGELSEATE